MNPRRPYNPDRRKNQPPLRLWLGVGAVSLGLAFTLNWLWPRPPLTQGVEHLPSPPPPSATPLATRLVVPTLAAPLTLAPSISPTPRLTPTPRPTQIYFTQSGDTLPVLAARFGVTSEEIQAPQGLQGAITLQEGQALIIPRVFSETTPAEKLLPDSEVVFSGAAAGFDPQQFAVAQGSYLATYKGYVEEATRLGGNVLLLAAQNHSVNPRLLTALLEYRSGWVTQAQPAPETLTYPLGYPDTYHDDLYSQLSWATSQLAIGYYGWRDGSLTELHFPDGTTLRIEPSLNAGTVAVQYFFAQTLNRPEWEQAIGPAGFLGTYRALFGDPWARSMLLIPTDLTQPPLALPLLARQRWSFTGGPHGAWEHGGAQAALDFAPIVQEIGCLDSEAWVVAMAAGKVVRADYGSVLLDLDGDGRETTGWVILYLHLADEDRVQAGEFVEAGQPIGHPSCRGGQATGTHVHVARKYNGEWIPAGGVVPFTLSGWVAHRGEREYLGELTRGDSVVTACTCADAASVILADEP